jgi:hypothetical protein
MPQVPKQDLQRKLVDAAMAQVDLANMVAASQHVVTEVLNHVLIEALVVKEVNALYRGVVHQLRWGTMSTALNMQLSPKAFRLQLERDK